MEALGFDQYGQLMKLYLQKYKEVTKIDGGKPGSHMLPGGSIPHDFVPGGLYEPGPFNG